MEETPQRGNEERSTMTTIEEMMENIPAGTTQSTVTSMSDASVMMNDLDILNLHEEQLCAYVIITHHLTAKQHGEAPDQLLMVLTGEGGTGKS